MAVNPDIDCVLQRPAMTGECPTWCERSGKLFWVDVQQPALHRFDPVERKDDTWLMPAWIGSFALGGGRAEGAAVVALRTGIYRLDLSSGSLTLIAHALFDSRRFMMNDGKCDRQGRFWVGAMFRPLPPIIEDATAPDKAPLWRLDGTSLVGMTDPVAVSNGVAWSPDGGTMYHSETKDGIIFAYDFEAETGSLSNKRVFAEVERRNDGGPDGAAVDQDGFYWCSVFGGGKLIRFDPSGKVEREIRMPVRYPTMPTFGGPGLATIYVTSAAWPQNAMDRERHPLEGSLFAFEAPVPGLPTSRWQGG